MVGNRRRVSGGQKSTLSDKAKPDTVENGYGFDPQGRAYVTSAEALEGPVVITDRVKFSINTRKARIDPGKKRVAFVRRLERVMRQCDKIMANPEGVEEIQVKAMSVLIRAIQVCYGIIVDVEVEELEHEIRSLEEEEERLATGEDETGTGYSIQEDPTQ